MSIINIWYSTCLNIHEHQDNQIISNPFILILIHCLHLWLYIKVFKLVCKKKSCCQTFAVCNLLSCLLPSYFMKICEKSIKISLFCQTYLGPPLSFTHWAGRGGTSIHTTQGHWHLHLACLIISVSNFSLKTKVFKSPLLRQTLLVSLDVSNRATEIFRWASVMIGKIFYYVGRIGCSHSFMNGEVKNTT